MPRSKELLGLKQKSILDSAYKAEYEGRLEEETKAVIDLQEDADIDIVVSGELGRDNYISFIAEHADGVKMMDTNEILELTGDKENLSKSLENMDASDNSMNNPVCVGKIDTKADAISGELKAIKRMTSRKFKATIPSPYLLTRSMWVKETSGKYYKDRAELGEDVVALIKNQIKRAVSLGASIIQLDEPILSEVVFVNAKGDASFY